MNVACLELGVACGAYAEGVAGRAYFFDVEFAVLVGGGGVGCALYFYDGVFYGFVGLGIGNAALQCGGNGFCIDLYGGFLGGGVM